MTTECGLNDYDLRTILIACDECIHECSVSLIAYKGCSGMRLHHVLLAHVACSATNAALQWVRLLTLRVRPGSLPLASGNRRQ